MSISSTTDRNTYTGNGSVSVYDYDFKLFEATDLEVFVMSTTGAVVQLTETTDFTVAGVGIRNGGSISLVNSGQAWLTGGGNLILNYKILLIRWLDLTQLTDIKNQGAYFPELHENEFDTIVMQLQMLNDQISRCAISPIFDTPDVFNPTWPAGITDPANASAILTLNADNTGFDLGPSVAEVSSDAAASAAAAAAAADSEAAATASEAAATASATAASTAQTAAAASATSAASASTSATTAAAAAVAAAAALYNATVGVGGNYATLALALAAASAGWKICILDSATIGTQITVALNNIQIDFNPGVTYSQGSGFTNPCIDINASGVRINNGRFLNFPIAIQVENGKNFNFVRGCRFNTCTVQISDLNTAANNVYSDNITEA